MNNASIIKLSAKLSDDLIWDLAHAHALKQQGKRILWDIDLGLTESVNNLNFNAQMVALEHFVKTVLPEFENSSDGVILYRGDELLERYAFNSDDGFEEWIQDKKQALIGQESHFKRVHAAGIFTEYLHRVMSVLPDTLNVYCAIEFTELKSPSYKAQIFSKERFEYIQLLEDSIEAELAIVVPLDTHCSKKTMLAIDTLCDQLDKIGFLYRLIPEFCLAQNWEGIKGLVVISEAISAQGKRKLLGFVAAGGMLIVQGNPLEFADSEAQAPFEVDRIEELLGNVVL